MGLLAGDEERAGHATEVAAAQQIPHESRLLADGRRRLLPRHLADDALRRRLLAVADCVAGLVAAFVVAGVEGESLETVLWTLGLLPLIVVVAKLHGLYDRDHRALRHLTVDELGSIASWATVVSAVALPALALTSAGAPNMATALRFWLALTLLDPLLRGLARVVWRRWTEPSPVLLLGDGPLERATRRKLTLFEDIHMRCAGRLDMADLVDAPDTAEARGRAAEACGGVLPDRVIVCTTDVREPDLARVVAFCRAHRMKLSVVPPLRGAFGTAVRLSHVAELPLLEYHTGDASISTLMLKRAGDIAVSALVLVLSAPLFVLVAAAIRIDSRGPVLYRQRRAGLEGRPFVMLKFRTMVDGAEARLGELISIEHLPDPVFKLRDDPRVTRVGRVLRRWSLDELPQLVNVVRGEMSLVGPRPEQIELVERYEPEHRFRLDVRPGMTGPMQVFGRGALAFDERLAVERDYIENVSLGRDLRILLMTLPVVLSGRGAF